MLKSWSHFSLKGYLWQKCYNCDKIHIKFSRLTTLSAQFIGIKYIHIVVQPSPPSSHRSPFILENWKSVPIKQQLPSPGHSWHTTFYILYPWIYYSQFSHSVVSTLCDPMDCSMLGLPDHHQLPEFTQTHVHWVGDAIQPSHPLSSPSPPALNLSRIRVFSNESALRIRWPKYWSFSFSISTSSEYSGLISFTMDWLDLLAIQGTCKSLLQHHSSKASILWHSAFFIVQISHLYMTIGKTNALTRQTFVGKVMSLLFNMLSRLAITFLPRRKCLLISWLW